MKVSLNILIVIILYTILKHETTMIPRYGLKCFIVIQTLSVTWHYRNPIVVTWIVEGVSSFINRTFVLKSECHFGKTLKPQIKP